jgi:hypothetical protein
MAAGVLARESSRTTPALTVEQVRVSVDLRLGWMLFF